MSIKIINLPEKKQNTDVDTKITQIVDDRNKVIAKRFNLKPRDITVNLHYKVDNLKKKVNLTGDNTLGVFAGYVDGLDSIEVAHPVAVEPIFVNYENLYKQFGIYIDYCLIKLYMCKKYYPEIQDFKRYHMFLTEGLAKITSGNFQKTSVEFLIKQYSDFKKFKKDEEVIMTFFVMIEKSGLDFIYSHLDTFEKDKDIKKSIMTIYKKEFKELIGLYQKEMIETEKKLKAVR